MTSSAVVPLMNKANDQNVLPVGGGAGQADLREQTDLGEQDDRSGSGEHERGLADRLLTIGKDCAGRLKEPFRSAEHGDLLYDERGLPR